MRAIGFSTGAVAGGDVLRGLTLLETHASDAVELSALRDHELAPLMRACETPAVARYTRVSVHAPTRFVTISEREAADLLAPCIDRGWPVILHPDVILDPACWRPFGRLACIENMDSRKSVGRTAAELAAIFEALPEASLCFDFGHARQVDSTLATAREILRAYGDRLLQAHLSEVDAAGRHSPLSLAGACALRRIAHLLEGCPIVLESCVAPGEIAAELAYISAAVSR